jgi:hypothetical protein
MLGEEMAKNQCTKERTVKNIKRYIGSFDMSTRYAIQQFLSWFDVDRKLERVVWAILKKSEIVRARQAKEVSRKNRILEKMDQGSPVSREERESVIPELATDVGPVVGSCPRCGSNVRGMIGGTCGKHAGNFGKLTFYKECTACSYYSEIFKKRNKYIEVEGG